MESLEPAIYYFVAPVAIVLVLAWISSRYLGISFHVDEDGVVVEVQS